MRVTADVAVSVTNEFPLEFTDSVVALVEVMVTPAAPALALNDPVVNTPLVVTPPFKACKVMDEEML